jgi:hypothetical protein
VTHAQTTYVMSKAHSLQRIKGGIVYLTFMAAYTVAVLLRPGLQDDVRKPPPPTSPPPPPAPLSHALRPQTVYLQQWLAQRQLVSLYLPCNNVQKKGFLSIAKYGAPRLASRGQRLGSRPNQKTSLFGCKGRFSLQSAVTYTPWAKAMPVSRAMAAQACSWAPAPPPRAPPAGDTPTLASSAKEQES